MATTLTTHAEVLQDEYAPMYTEAMFRNSSLVPLFGPPMMSPGGDSRKWLVHSGVNDSVKIFDEGDASSDPGNQAYVTASLSYLHLQGLTQITGHARAALRSGHFDSIDEEATGCIADMVDLYNTSLMGSTYGLLVAVDSTTTFAGIARGAASYFESKETAVSGILALSDLQDLEEALKDNDRGARLGSNGLILSAMNQRTRYYNVTGGPATQMIGDRDKAPALSGQLEYAGMPFIGLPDFDDNTLLMLDMSENNWDNMIHEDFMVHDQGRSGDSDVFMFTFRGNLICKNPVTMGKLTSLTT